jgi:hypothetical protein
MVSLALTVIVSSIFHILSKGPVRLHRAFSLDSCQRQRQGGLSVDTPATSKRLAALVLFYRSRPGMQISKPFSMKRWSSMLGSS